ncbi:MAG: NAD(P)/FAD-dependent oxidoreductase [Parachlamydiales bacterium]
MDCHVLIIGGGVAGLAAANHLADAGCPALVLEAGTYPSHKVCGEFVSPEALPILERWGLAPQIRLSRADFHYKGRTLSFDLPQAAGSAPRYIFDTALAARVEVLTSTSADSLIKRDDLWVAKVGQKELSAPYAIIGTGRLTGQKRPHFPYRGYKAHFRGSLDHLEMHLFKGAYLGISQVAPDTLNVACLSKGPCNPSSLLPFPLKPLFDWLEVPAPEFGVRPVPNWENALFIGDAAGTVAPICGEGLAMGITSGVMAAEYILNNKAPLFRQAWLKRYTRRIAIAKALHRALLQTPALLMAGHLLPTLSPWLFRATREIDGLVCPF